VVHQETFIIIDVMARRRFQARTGSPQTHRCSSAVLGIGDFRDFRRIFYFCTAYRDPYLDGSGGPEAARLEGYLWLVLYRC
jgi:hypothetical protein